MTSSEWKFAAGVDCRSNVDVETAMKALRVHARGGPEQLFFEDAPAPDPGPGEARVRVYAAAITPTELLWDQTYLTADGKPRIPGIPGHDFSGVVDSLGPGVQSVAVGDAVYGLVDFPHDGTAAELTVVPAADLAPKPSRLDWREAAAVPLSALTAWQALFDHGNLPEGGKVLIHGAAGGVGAYAVQLAHARGAEIFATSSERHSEFLRSLGVDHVIDYQKAAFEDIARDIDVVLDTRGGETLERSWKTLRCGGRLVTVYGPIPQNSSRPENAKGIFFIVRPNRAELIEIGKLIDAGKLRPFVEAVYPLSDGRSAFEHAAAGHLGGKIVLEVVG
jgi:NADPH:quinone reductase-like Zn-dependent oxidoreductase